MSQTWNYWMRDERSEIREEPVRFLLLFFSSLRRFSRRLDVRPLITHRFPLAQTAAAIGLASQPTEDSLKIIVEGTACHRP